MAQMVDEFNKLVDEHRYAEAEVVANRLYEMAPEELVAQQVNNQAKLIRRERWNQDINAQAENGVANTFLRTRETAAEALAQGDTPLSYREQLERLQGPQGCPISVPAAASRSWKSSRSSRRRFCRSTTKRRSTKVVGATLATRGREYPSRSSRI